MPAETLIDIAAPFAGLIDEELVAGAVEAALRQAGERGEVLVSVRVTDNGEIHRLNREFRHVDRPTDVLSFQLEAADLQQPGMPRLLGDVVLSYPYLVQQAADLGHPFEHELAWLTIHGTLQLAGFTHDTEEDAVRMEALEAAALAELGFSAE